MTDVAAKFRDLLYEGRACVTELLVGHDEDRFDFGLKVAVHQRHVEFELKVGKRAETADDRVGFLCEGKVHEQTAEGGGCHVGERGEIGREHRQSLFRGEERAFAGVVGDGDSDAVEEFCGPGKDVEMSVGDGVKRTGIDAMAHGERCLETKVRSGRLAMMFSPVVGSNKREALTKNVRTGPGLISGEARALVEVLSF